MINFNQKELFLAVVSALTISLPFLLYYSKDSKIVFHILVAISIFLAVVQIVRLVVLREFFSTDFEQKTGETKIIDSEIKENIAQNVSSYNSSCSSMEAYDGNSVTPIL